MRRIIGRFLIIMMIAALSSCEKTGENDISSSLKLYGDALEDIGYSISKTEGGFYIGGQMTEVFRSGDKNNYIEVDKSVKKMVIIRIDQSGNVLWKKKFGNSVASAGAKVITLDDGSAVCLGYTTDSITKQKDVLLVKISPDGQHSVIKTFNSAGTSNTGNDSDGNQYGIDMAQDSYGLMLLCSTDLGRMQGATGNIEGKSDMFLLRVDTDLNLIAEPESIGFPGNDAGAAIKADPDGGFIILGTTDRTQPGQGANNIMLVKINSQGSTTQMKMIGNDDDEYASDIEVLSDGYLITGTVGNSSAEQSVFVSRLTKNISNDVLSQSKYKLVSDKITATSFSVRAVSRYGSQSFVMTGQAGTGSSAKLLVFVANMTGIYVEGKTLITAANGIQTGYDVLADENGNIFTVGRNAFENNSMISFYKFRF